MDIIGGQAKSLQKELGSIDRDKLDQMFTSVRELELRLVANEKWIHRPKPEVDMEAPSEAVGKDWVESQKTMLKISELALQTDSTRFISLHMRHRYGVNALDGVDEDHHTLSHHGRNEEKIEQLALIENYIMESWADFLRYLKNSQENGQSILDNTTILMTSNMGNASSHSNDNLPVLLAGGGFKHGQHLAFDQEDNYPLPKLYVSALQRMGLKYDKFSTVTGTMRGLDMV